MFGLITIAIIGITPLTNYFPCFAAAMNIFPDFSTNSAKSYHYLTPLF